MLPQRVQVRDGELLHRGGEPDGESAEGVPQGWGGGHGGFGQRASRCGVGGCPVLARVACVWRWFLAGLRGNDGALCDDETICTYDAERI